MGYLAYGHPFLDGNGRTIMVVHSVLARRAGIDIDWASTDKNGYLSALTEEINSPGKGHLDEYLRPVIRPAGSEIELIAHIKDVPGLRGGVGVQAQGDEIIGKVSEPSVRELYQAQRMRRQQSETSRE